MQELAVVMNFDQLMHVARYAHSTLQECSLVNIEAGQEVRFTPDQPAIGLVTVTMFDA